MTQRIQEPEVVERERGETVTTHPAFAQIRASRVSGHTSLYGSDFVHQHFVEITICRSQEIRNLSREWYFGRGQMVSVSLSEAQWAAFVSSMNVGDGVPCTLTWNQGPIPGLPPPKPTTHKFKQDIQEDLQEALSRLEAVAAQLDGPLSKTKAAELKRSLDHARKALVGSVTFVAESFDEHVEATVEKAKIEVNAYVQAKTQQAGLRALGLDPPLKLEP